MDNVTPMRLSLNNLNTTILYIISNQLSMLQSNSILFTSDNMGLVNRPYAMVVKYYNAQGIEHIDTFTGFEATVLSHELDHLDGILHMDIAEEVLVMPKEERKIFRKTHPYEILSKDCEYSEDLKMNHRNI